MKKLRNIKFIAAILMIAALTAAVLSGCGESGSYATQKNFITIGCVCPLTGELASYGEGTLETEEAAVAGINETDGVYIDTLQRKLKIRFVVADSESTEAGAKAAAKYLIEEENVDLMICSSGTMTSIAAASVCEKEQVPFFAVNAENESWLEAGPFSYCFNCSYDNESRIAAFADIWEEQEVDSVGLLAVTSDGAEAFAESLTAYGEEHGITVATADAVDPASLDFSSAAKALTAAKVDAVIFYMTPAEFSAAWNSDEVKAISPKVSALTADQLFGGDMKAIERGLDVKEFYTATCWDKKYPFDSSLTDETSSELGLWWEDTFLSPSSEISGFKHGCVEIAMAAVKLAMALDAESIVSAASSLNVRTIIGEVDFNQNKTCVLPCSLLKWSFDSSTASWTKELASHDQLQDVEFDDD